jgi:hypothetical protein
VANVFLRYEPLLEEQFGYVKTVAKTNKYKVLEAVKIPQGKELKKEKYKKRRPVSLDEDEEFG